MPRIYPVIIDRVPDHDLQLKPEKKVVVHMSLKPMNLKVSKPKPAMIPQMVDLRTNSKMPPVYDQGDLGSCVANAFCAAYDFDSPGYYMGSRLFLYYNQRVIDNTVNQDSGAKLKDGVTALKKYGLCPESMWPYNITQFTVRPPQRCYRRALSNKVLTAYNIKNTLPSMQNALINGLPFIVGILIYSSFETQEVATTGIVPMPKQTDRVIGGHAVLVVGYDNSKQWFIVRNSWGPNWGIGGYFYLPYSYLLNPRLSSDLWTINSIT